MDNNHDAYNSPFSSRYASKEMQYIFSDNFKFRTWRKLWISLAEAEKEQGLNITDEQIAELKAHADDINYDVAKAREKEVRHDVMSHVYAFGVQCPKAEPIIHLGATSCYVGDNTDIITMREAGKLVLKKTAAVLQNLKEFALKYKALPCLAYTHLQPAQLTTVGKRAALWMNELCGDVKNLEFQLSCLKLLGSKGTTGTQASFMELFGNDESKVDAVENKIAKDFGFKECVPVSGQTYSRKTDYFILSALSGIAQSAYKFANDMRLLQSFEELEEPFGTKQIGSSAMPYKRNPMRCERICALARYIICDLQNPSFTAPVQWLERTLDDSANKRISVAEAFLATDAVLSVFINVTDGIVVYDKVIEKRVMEKLPFMATENIMMESVKRGGDRQELHEIIRELSHKATKQIKLEGKKNPLIDMIAEDKRIPLTKEEITAELKPEKFIGRCVSQVESFVSSDVDPILEKYAGEDIKIELNV